jgi:hypothetical protein
MELKEIVKEKYGETARRQSRVPEGCLSLLFFILICTIAKSE